MKKGIGKHSKGKLKRVPIDQHIDWIEMMLFDRDEPGCGDDERGDMHLTLFGRIQLQKRLKQIREEGGK
jgi:hypothetical protein